MAKNNTVEILFVPKGADNLNRALKSLDKSTKALINTQSKLIQKTKQHENVTKKSTRSTRLLNNAFATIRSKLLLINFGLGLGIKQLAGFGKQASKVESMRRAFETLSGATGGSRVALQDLKIATNDTMTEFDLFQQANNAMILGVTKNSNEMAEMFDIAQRLGRALGRDTASSVESLITGIGRQSRLMLDNIGIIVKTDEAYESYAKKIGVAVDQLTDQEKKQAFLSATMESARKKVKSLGEEVKSSQDMYDTLSTATSNLAVEIGEALQPALSTTAGMFSTLAQRATQYLKSINLANSSVTENMSNEEQLSIKIAQHAKERKKLNLLISSGVMTTRFHNEVSKTSKELEQEILLLMSKIRKEREDRVLQIDAETNAGTEGNEVLDYRVQIQEQELTLLQQKNEDLIGGMSLIEQITAIEQERALLNLNALEKNITEQEFQKQSLALTGKEITLEESLLQAKLKTTSAVLQGLSALAGMSKQHAQLAKTLAIAGAVVDMYAGANKAFKQGGALGFFTGASIIAQGTANIAKMQAQKFEQGGEVGGNRHSQGGTMIEAEKGEFVMSRNAVNSVGLDNLESMNNGGSTGININIAGNFIGEESFIRDTLIPEIQKVQNTGLA